MGFRFRKSINLGGGFRLNLSKSGIGVSGGMKGFRVGAGSKGTRMTTSLPGTGVGYEKRWSHKTKRRSETANKVYQNRPGSFTSPSVSPLQLGLLKKLFLPKHEVRFVRAVKAELNQNREQALQMMKGADHLAPNETDVICCLLLWETDSDKRLVLAERLTNHQERFGAFFDKYGILMRIHLPITEELTREVVNDRTGLTLLLAEIFQENDRIDKALELLGKLPEDTRQNEPLVILSLGELYFDQGDHEAAVTCLQQLENNDDIGTTALIYQGLAFHEMEQYGVAIECFKRATRRKKDRTPQLLLEARYQMGLTYEKMGEVKKAQAEYEKVLSEDLNFRDTGERLERLGRNCTLP